MIIKPKQMLLDEKVLEDLEYYMPEEETIKSLTNFFSIFSDATRLKIISALSVSEMCVTDISNILGLNQTTVSHQLKQLKSVGAVRYRRDGKVIYYSIANAVINECLLSGADYIMG